MSELKIKKNLKRFLQHSTYPYIASGILFVGITIWLFLVGEELQYGKPIKSQKFGDFGTFIASIATTVTLIVIYKQIGENREVASLPDLYPSETNFEVQDNSLPTFYRMIKGNKEIYSSTHISLYNIGLGASKEILINWSYNKKEVEQFINDEYYALGVEHNEVKIDFIPTNSSIDISIPKKFMACCGLRFNKAANIVNPQSERPKPALELLLSYRDIFNKKHNKSFDVQFDCYMNSVIVKFHQNQNYS